MKWEPEFKGYWSERDKEIWQNTDWKARDYEELPVEDEIVRDAYFYSMEGTIKKPIIFVKYIRPNPIFDPYYGPVMNAELKEFVRGRYVGAMYDGRSEGKYHIHDRFETQELYNRLST